MPLKTPFYDFHVSQGAKMVEFAGWELPLLYGGIVQEHEQTRHSGSIFDVSHMGRIYLTGKDAGEFLNRVLSRQIADQAIGQSRYSLICNETGGVLDDVIVSRDSKNWLIVCNGSNREKIVRHLGQCRKQWDADVDIADQTQSTAMVAIQGPKVIERLSGSLPVDIKSLKRYHFISTSYMLVRFTLFRSGYSGEDGIELILPAKMGPMAIKMLAGRTDKPDATIKPAGLGARDTLRLEAGLPLYGHELTEQTDPLSAGLQWAVDLSKEFMGCQALRKIQADGVKEKLVGLELQGPRIARQDTPVLHQQNPIGRVTSGTFAPTLQKSIALAYVAAEHAQPGTQLSVQFKDHPAQAQVVALPFYRRA